MLQPEKCARNSILLWTKSIFLQNNSKMHMNWQIKPPAKPQTLSSIWKPTLDQGVLAKINAEYDQRGLNVERS